MSNVKCLVEECKYNNCFYCNANEIEVRSSGTASVYNPDETACETFQRKDLNSLS